MRFLPLLFAGCSTLSIPLYDEPAVFSAHPSLRDRVVEADKYVPPEPEEKPVDWILDDDRVVGAGDRVRIEVRQDPALDREVTIDVAGEIDFPLAGRIQADRIPARELKKNLEVALSRVLREPEVVVRVPRRPLLAADVAGRVRRPGRIEFRLPPWLSGAITQSGGYAPDANPTQVIVVRADKAVVSNRFDDRQNIPLADGDVVIVTRLYDPDERPCAAEWGPVTEFLAGKIDRAGLIERLK